MIFGQNRNELRQMYIDAWNKQLSKQPLSPLEAQIADVVAEHPEYHAALSDNALQQEFAPEDGKTNPFLHMGLHLGIREQVGTNRPAGIRAVFDALCSQRQDAHAAEHQMIEILAETLWEAQSRNGAPDEHAYLERLRQLT